MSTHYITAPGGIPYIEGVFPVGSIVEVDDVTKTVLAVTSMATGEPLLTKPPNVPTADNDVILPGEMLMEAPPTSTVIGG